MLWEFNWGLVAEVAFFLSITFLALPLGIAFNCESLAKRAKNRLSKERALFRKEQGNAISREYDRLGQLLAKAAGNGSDESEEKDIVECYKSVRHLRKMIGKYVKGLKDIARWRTRSSILILGVLCSGICIFLSAILSGSAWSLEETELFVPVWYSGYSHFYCVYLNHFLLILAAVSFILGVYFGARTLWVTLARSK
jgi:hypothetical protein